MENSLWAYRKKNWNTTVFTYLPSFILLFCFFLYTAQSISIHGNNFSWIFNFVFPIYKLSISTIEKKFIHLILFICVIKLKSLRVDSSSLSLFSFPFSILCENCDDYVIAFVVVAVDFIAIKRIFLYSCFISMKWGNWKLFECRCDD